MKVLVLFVILSIRKMQFQDKMQIFNLFCCFIWCCQ